MEFEIGSNVKYIRNGRVMTIVNMNTKTKVADTEWCYLGKNYKGTFDLTKLFLLDRVEC